MNRLIVCLTTLLICSANIVGQGQQATQQQPEPPRAEAKKEVIVNWTLGEQTWSFREIDAAYEPEKGTIEPSRYSRSGMAVWTLRLVKDFDPGTTLLHDNQPATPFKIVFLDSDRTVINIDAAARMTPVSGKIGDTVQLYIELPDPQLLKDIRYVRVMRRTNIGF